MVHTTSLVLEKMQFDYFPIISLWELSVAMANQTERQITIILAILNCPYPSNICTRLVILPQLFGDVIKKNIFFLKFNVAMATKQNGHWS